MRCRYGNRIEGKLYHADQRVKVIYDLLESQVERERKIKRINEQYASRKDFYFLSYWPAEK